EAHGRRGRPNRGFSGRPDRRDLHAADAGTGPVRPDANQARRMKMKRMVVGLLVLALAFGAGTLLGRNTKQDVMISSSTAGASYSGGFKAEGEGGIAAKAAAPIRS